METKELVMELPFLFPSFYITCAGTIPSAETVTSGDRYFDKTFHIKVRSGSVLKMPTLIRETDLRLLIKQFSMFDD